jgi:hypothetical protein
VMEYKGMNKYRRALSKQKGFQLKATQGFHSVRMVHF